MKRLWLCGALAAQLLFASAATGGVVLTLTPPNGAIIGSPGQTIGWGFTFMNDADYALITGTQLCDASSAPLPDICIPLAPTFGGYTDFAGLEFLVAGPAPETTSISQPFDLALLSGLGSFAIDPGASGSLAGLILVTYDLYSVSPNDPLFSADDGISFGNFVTSRISISLDGGTSPVPEPASLALVSASLMALAFTRRKKRQGAVTTGRLVRRVPTSKSI